MDATTPTESLKGRLLIAMPGMGDPRFERSVVYLCEHSDQGAMGLIVNKPLPEISFEELVEQLEIRSNGSGAELAVHFGGPVETGRGFVLHGAEYGNDATSLTVDDRFRMTATLDVLHDIANGTGPQRVLFALGYAGWGEGQLESELQDNGWLTADADPDVVFAGDDSGKWAAALRGIGVDAHGLSASAGRA